MEVYTYLVDLPAGVSEMVTPCLEGYTIYIDSALTFEGRMKAYNHAMYHITHGDFDKTDVQSIESEAHRKVVIPNDHRQARQQVAHPSDA